MSEKFYELLHGKSSSSFVQCDIPEKSPWTWISWITGEKINLIELKKLLLKAGIEDANNIPDIVPEPIEYHVEYYGRKMSLEVDDFPWASRCALLMSKKMFNVIKNSGASFDIYKSIILYPGGKILDDYLTLNLTEAYMPLDLNRSDCKIDKNTGKICYISKMVLKRSLMPESKGLFLVSPSYIVSENIKNELEKYGIIGPNYSPIDITEDIN